MCKLPCWSEFKFLLRNLSYKRFSVVPWWLIEYMVNNIIRNIVNLKKKQLCVVNFLVKVNSFSIAMLQLHFIWINKAMFFILFYFIIAAFLFLIFYFLWISKISLKKKLNIMFELVLWQLHKFHKIPPKCWNLRLICGIHRRVYSLTKTHFY